MKILIALFMMVYCLPSTPQSQLDESVVYRRMMLRKRTDGYREGSPWTDSNVYVNTVEYAGYPPGCFIGRACYGFMIDMMEYASNYEYPIRIVEGSYDNLPEIHVGDGVRVMNDSHSVVVLEVNGNMITVVEGNWNKSVHWGRKINISEPSMGFTWVATFWPDEYSNIIDFDTNNYIRDIFITDMSGALLKSVHQTEKSIQTLLKELPKGVYIIKEKKKVYKVCKTAD